MSSTVALASRLRALSDNALTSVLEARGVTAGGIRDFFDLADALLSPDNLHTTLTRLDRRSLATLLGGDAEPATSARLSDLALVDAGATTLTPWPEVVAALVAWPERGLPDARASTPAPPAHPVDPAARITADRLAAEHAFAATTATTELLFELEREPARLLSRGGIGQPETRRLAKAMAIGEPLVPTLVAAAESSGLVRRLDARLELSEASAAWLALPASERWIALAETWARTLPGDIRGRLAEHPETLWGPGLRAWLAWLYPAGGDWLAERIDVRLREAEHLGVTAGEIVSTAGGALLAGEPGRAARVLEAGLPSEVHQVYLQHDLTAVAPGPLEPSVDARLRSMADVEGRAIASRFRFTSESLGRAIAHGDTADSLRAFLTEVSLSGVPQPLDYLLTETAARHGSLRVGSLPSGDPEAVSYVRSADAALLGTVLVDRSLAALAFTTGTDGRLFSRRERGQVYWALVEARYPAAAEDSRGRILTVSRPAMPHARPAVAPDPIRQLIERVRLADAGTPDDPDQAWLHRQLEAAIRTKEIVTVSVRMPNGSTVDFRLEPASLAGGRLRARDPLSEIERTLPLTSIAAVHSD